MLLSWYVFDFTYYVSKSILFREIAQYGKLILVIFDREEKYKLYASYQF